MVFHCHVSQLRKMMRIFDTSFNTWENLKKSNYRLFATKLRKLIINFASTYEA